MILKQLSDNEAKEQKRTQQIGVLSRRVVKYNAVAEQAKAEWAAVSQQIVDIYNEHHLPPSTLAAMVDLEVKMVEYALRRGGVLPRR